MPVSVNSNAVAIVEQMLAEKEILGIKVDRIAKGAILLDAGIEASGSVAAGRKITEICMGGLGTAALRCIRYDDMVLPSIYVETDHPAVSLLGSQLAGWNISVEGFNALASGPARALSLKPKELYRKMSYQDKSNSAVVVLETSKKPNPEAIGYISGECGVKPENLYVITTPTGSLAGSVQICGRVAEAGLHKLDQIGFDISKVTFACGEAPVAPVHGKFTEAMGRTNDMLLYGGAAFFTVNYEDDSALKKIVEKAPSSASTSYGKPFLQIFEEANRDFYKIDPGLFAPAMVTVNNEKTGSVFTAGKVNPKLVAHSVGLIH